MTGYCVHKPLLPAVLLVCLCAFFLAPGMGPAPAGAAGDPNGTVSGTGLSGDYTYAQVHTTSSQFKYEGGTLTLTGNINGELLTTSSHSRNITFDVASDAGNAALVLQKGTFRANIRLGGNANTSTLVVGSGATSNLPTVTVTGSLMGSNNGFSHVRTNGANLVINGWAGENNYIGQMSALNGDITMSQDSRQNQVGIVSVAGGMRVFSQTRLVLNDLDIRNGGTVAGGTEIHVNGALGRPGGQRMQAGSLLTAGGSISFLDPNNTGTGGVLNASGTIHADANIGSYGSFPAYDILQGNGHLTIEAGGSIGGRNITADSISAGGSIVAGVDRTSAAQIGVSSPFTLTPSKTLTGTTIKAGLIAAGEVADIAGVSSPSRIEAGRMMVVEGAEGSSGNFTLHNGSFAITGTTPVGASGYDESGAIVSHDEAAWVGGNLDVNNNGASSFTSLGVAGDARISGGSATGDTLSASSVTLHNGIDATVNSATVTEGNMQIGAAGDTAAATDVKLGALRLNRHGLRVGAGAGEAWGAVQSFVTEGGAGLVTDGDITVGRGGRLAVGTRDTGALKAIAARAGTGPTTAVLGVFSPMVLGANLTVDGEALPAAARVMARSAAPAGRAATGPLSFSGNSLLVIDGAKAGVNYANPAVPTASLPASVPGAISAAAPAEAGVAGGAKIYIDHVTPGHTYVALGKNITTRYADDTAWAGGNLLSSNPLLGLERLGNGMEGQFGVVEHAREVKRISASGGVARMARSASETMETAIFHRIKLGEEDLYRRSFALWALPVYEHIHHFGLEADDGRYGYEGDIGGLVIGGDYTWRNTLRTGLALNMGTGYARSHGDAATKNSIDFWGAGAYAVWKPGQFSLDADLNFTWTDNRLKQKLPADISSSRLKGDVDTWSMGAGLRAEYEIDTEYLIIRPHAGFRYFHLDSAPYNVSLDGRDVLHASRSRQNVWTFPFGIVFTKNIRIGDGYELTPLINLKGIPASGDTRVKNNVIYAGAHRGEELSTQVMDSMTWGGRAGLELRAGDASVAVNYTAQFGRHTANQGVFGVLRYEF